MKTNVRTHLRRKRKGRSIVRYHKRRIARHNRLFGFGRAKELPVKYPLHPFSRNLRAIPGDKKTFLLVNWNPNDEELDVPRPPIKLETYGGRRKKGYVVM